MLSLKIVKNLKKLNCAKIDSNHTILVKIKKILKFALNSNFLQKGFRIVTF